MKKLLLFFGIWLLGCFVLSSQTTSFISYGMEQGLVQNQVQSITQDQDGNLWTGTISGLSMYDGTHWTTYNKNNGMAEDWVTCSFKDAQGNLWFGHWAGGVTRFNAQTQLMENLKLEEYTRFKSIRAIAQDFTGKLWIATEGAGVFIFDPNSGKMYAISVRDGLSSGSVYDICMDDQKNVWMATDSGLTVFNLNKSVSNASSFVKISTAQGLYSKNITSVRVTSSNLLVMGSADEGLAIVPLTNGNTDWQNYIRKNQVVFGSSKGLNSTFIKTIYEDRERNIWVGTIGGGVSKFITGKGNLSEQSIRDGFFKTFSTRQGLNYFNVNAIFEDREKNLWIGTDLGLNQYRGDFLETFDESDDLPNNIVWSVFADSKNNIWMGTNNGLAKMWFSYEREGKIEVHHIEQIGAKQGLHSNVILSIFEDSNGNLWFGTSGDGVYMLPKGGNSFKNYGLKQGLANETVYSIAEDRNGFMWFGTKAGASRMNVETATFRNFTESDGLGGNHIYRIFKDSKGILWIGALGGNLSMYDGNSFKTYSEDNGLKHKFILCINEDRSGNLWFGCYGGGLSKFDGRNFINYSIREGLRCESPYSIVIDKSNQIWIGDNRGIDRFDIRQNRFYHYGRNEGFSGVECNPNASCIDDKGRIWLGTIMGAVRFNPSEEIPNDLAPLTKITGIKISLKDTAFPSDATFGWKQNHLTFKFIGVSLTNPEKIKYEYTLEGFDRGWIPAKELQQATYTNLQAGTYTFKVRSYNNNGICSPPTQYKFTVNPPFWQTAIFYVLLTLFVLFGMFVADKIRTRNLRERNMELELRVKERTQQLAIKNEELAEKNKDITDSIRYAKRIQDGSLANEDFFRKYLPDSFIFFKPKDIVSGDFFWIKKENNRIYFAVIDCTGHGVPGAFLSIVAHNLLNQAFQSAGDTSTGKILDTLHILAGKMLQSKVNDISLRDGMDIALCSVDDKFQNLEYAGAYNALYLVRQNKLIEYAADNISLGSDEYADRKFTTHSIALEKGDLIYIFSDGFADQFGGDKGKKFKYQPFQQLLVKNNNKGIDQQRMIILNEFETWKGASEQVDDVLIIGVRF